jgi:hypothetical protein
LSYLLVIVISVIILNIQLLDLTLKFSEKVTWLGLPVLLVEKDTDPDLAKMMPILPDPDQQHCKCTYVTGTVVERRQGSSMNFRQKEKKYFWFGKALHLLES